jgi:hypothetical protein
LLGAVRPVALFLAWTESWLDRRDGALVKLVHHSIE